MMAVNFVHHCIASAKQSACVGRRWIGLLIVQQMVVSSLAFRILLCHIDVHLAL